MWSYELEIRYREAIRPSNLILHIKDFPSWLKLATCKKDLEDTLKAFEEEELYEHCVFIKQAIEDFQERGCNMK